MKKPKTLEEAFDMVSNHLPEDWSLRITIEQGLRSFDLLYPPDASLDATLRTGFEQEVADDPFADEDCSCQIEMIIRRVNYAREYDGLDLLDFEDVL